MQKTYAVRQYPAKVIKVYDGDTVTVDINLGFDITLQKSVRFADVNCLEVRGEEREEGLKARDALREKILGKDVVIETMLNSKGNDRSGRYKRPLVRLYLGDECVSDWLVDQGLATWREEQD